MTPTRLALALAFATALSTAAAAQDTSHDSHHPAGDQPQAAAPAAPQAPGAAQPNAPSQVGNMMGSGGMMGSGDMMSMMRMMGMMGQGAGGMSNMGMPGMDMADRVEGRIAFLRTELKITDAQGKVWSEFAQSLRDNAGKLGGMRGMMGQSAAAQTLTQRLDEQEKWYAARLDGIRALKRTTADLYAALSDEQKKTADQVLPPHLGLMPMMTMGMMSMSGQSGMPQSGMPRSGMPKGMVPGDKP